MKTLLTTFALAAATCIAAAQPKTVALASAAPAVAATAAGAPDAYTSAMLDIIAAQSVATTPAALQATLAQLERVAAAAVAAEARATVLGWAATKNETAPRARVVSRVFMGLGVGG